MLSGRSFGPVLNALHLQSPRTCAFALAVAACVAPVLAAAQESIPPEVLQKLGSDLSALQATVESAQPDGQASDWSRLLSKPLNVLVTGAAPTLRLGADQSAQVVAQLTAGQSLPVIDKADGWYAVKLGGGGGGQTVGWISAAEAVPEPIPLPNGWSARKVAEDAVRRVTTEVARLKDAYKNNPYVQISGFTVNVGVPLSVSVNFDFK